MSVAIKRLGTVKNMNGWIEDLTHTYLRADVDVEPLIDRNYEVTWEDSYNGKMQ